MSPRSRYRRLVAYLRGRDPCRRLCHPARRVEQEEAFARINDARLSRLVDAEDESAFFVRSLRRVAQLAEGELTPDVYRSRRRRLVADGEEVAEFNAVVRRFGSWSHAKRALALSDTDTVHKIKARFRARVRGKPRPFSAEELNQRPNKRKKK